MRVTSNMYYRDIYGKSSSQLNEKLFDVNKQIASGLNIQYAQDNVTTFAETMRLDNEITILDQIKQSSSNGLKMSNQADVVLNDFDTTTDRVKILLLNAANGSSSTASIDAISKELRSLEEHYKNLANTSINGQFLFSGSATTTKPISSDGTYMGNDKNLYSFGGSGIKQQYNISGAELFLGEEVNENRKITTNVQQFNLSAKYPNFTEPLLTVTDEGFVPSVDKPITQSDTIRDMMGDNDNSTDTQNTSFFYIRGVKSDGTAISEKISMTDDETVGDLLNNIGDIYGNTPTNQLVNVELNKFGQIVIEDKISGSSKLDFHMVGAVDYNASSGAASAADVLNINDLDVGEADFSKIMAGTSTATNPDLYVKEFVKSPYTNADGVGQNISGLAYDQTQFSKNGAKLESNVSQIVTATNKYATASTKLSEVADLSQTADGTLAGTTFSFKGTDINGASFTAEISLRNTTTNAGSVFSIDTDNDGFVDKEYDIFDMGDPRAAVAADDMTYQQFMDVINMVTTGNLPATDNTAMDDAGEALAYDKAIETANLMGNTSLSDDGKIEFQQINASTTKASFSINDVNSGNLLYDAAPMTFNANNALTISDPKTDFFKTLDGIISAVENYELYPDSNSKDSRNIGIQNAIEQLSDLQTHLSKAHSTVGAQSNSLNSTVERADLLKINTMTLRSSVIDVDLAEASLTLTQVSQTYEAMLSTVGRVSKLSLINYL